MRILKMLPKTIPTLRKLFGASLAFFLLMPPAVLGAECTHLWKKSLDIAPDTPKSMSGDTYAAYGLIGFYDEPNLRLEVKGEFPHGRFMSLQSYRSSRKRTVDGLFDRDIVADVGSTNPFIPGSDLNAAVRSYTVDIVKNREEARSANSLLLDGKTNIHSVFFRYYVPSNGYVPGTDDLPRIFAFDSRSGAPRPCPRYIDTQLDPGPITVILNFVKKKSVLTFERNKSFDNGVNAAVPGYVTAMSKIDQGDVSIIRFKAPTFNDTQSGTGPFPENGQVRYWSLCTQNLKESETLTCLPDYLATPDAQGWVTVVVGKGSALQEHAQALGHNFLEDRRLANQKVMGFFFRNLLPASGFAPYQGDYLPTGVVCHAQAYLNGSCGSYSSSNRPESVLRTK
jgi:hypothetical protein